MSVPQRTPFTNLSQLINANQQNRLGSTIQSGVGKDVSGLQQDVNQATQQFGTALGNANTNTQANQGYVSGAINNIINPAPPANANAPQGQVAAQAGGFGDGGSFSNQPFTGKGYGPGTGPNIHTNVDTGKPVISPIPNPTIRTNVGQASTQPGMVSALETPTAPSVSQVQTQNNKAVQPAGASTPTAPKAPSTTQASNLSALPGSFGYASNATSGTSQADTSHNPNAGDVSKFGQLMQGNYSGPNQLNNIAALQAKGTNIQDIGQNALRQGGLQNLLQQYVNSGNQYSRGQQALDTAILGQTGKPALQNVVNQTRSAGMLPQQAEANAENQAAQTAAGNKAFAGDITRQLAAAQTPIYQQIQQQLQNQTTQNSTMQDAANKIYGYLNNPLAAPVNGGSNKFKTPAGVQAAPTTQKEAANAALSSARDSGILSGNQYDTAMQIMGAARGFDPQQALRTSFNPYVAPEAAYTMQQGANADQASKLNALSQLSGLGNQFQTYGGMNPGSSSFDLGKFLAQAKTADTVYGNNNYQLPSWDTSPTSIINPILNGITNPQLTNLTNLINTVSPNAGIPNPNIPVDTAKTGLTNNSNY